MPQGKGHYSFYNSNALRSFLLWMLRKAPHQMFTVGSLNVWPPCALGGMTDDTYASASVALKVLEVFRTSTKGAPWCQADNMLSASPK
jgi:hypothetical protein